MSKSLVVFLHGSGGTGPEIRSFLDTVPLESFGMKTFRTVADEKKIEFVCPTAAKRPYTPALGERMNVWFDREGDFNRKGIKGIEDLKGADNSVEQVYFLTLQTLISDLTEECQISDAATRVETTHLRHQFAANLVIARYTALYCIRGFVTTTSNPSDC